MSFIKSIILFIFCIFLVNCAGSGGSRNSSGIKSNRKARQVKKDSALNHISVVKEIKVDNNIKITKLYNEIYSELTSALNANNTKNINEKLKELGKYKIKSSVFDDYKKAFNSFNSANKLLDLRIKEEIAQNKIKTQETEKYNKAKQQLDDEKVKLDNTKPNLKNFAKSKNTEPYGKTKQLNKAIEDDNYHEMIRWLNVLKLVKKDEEEPIVKYRAANKNVNLATQNVKDAEGKVKKINDILEKTKQAKEKAEKSKQDAEKKLNEEKQKLDNFVKSDDFKKQFKEQASNNPDFQKYTNLSSLKLKDTSGDVVVMYDYLDKNKDKQGQLIAIKVKKLIYNKVSDPNDKNYFFKFLPNDFTKEKDGSISATKTGKPIEIEYIERSPNDYVFEFENGYSGLSGVKKKVKLASVHSLLLSGSSVGLSYSDFGYLHETAIAKDNNKEIKKFNRIKTIVGGYDEKKIDMSKININEDISYSGKIVGFVTNTSGSLDQNKWKNEKLSGNIDLTLKKDKTEDVGISFKDYYNIKFKSNVTGYNVSGLALEDKRKAEGIYNNYTIDNSGTGNFKKIYYGDKTDKVGSEASGIFNYKQGNIVIDTTFGVKR